MYPSLNQILIEIGILLFILGIGFAIFSRKYIRKTVFESKKLLNLKIMSKGNPSVIGNFYSPYSTLLRIDFWGNTKQKVIFRLINCINVKNEHLTKHYQIPYKEKICGSGKIHFILEPNTQYKLEVESNIKGVNDEGLDMISKIFSKYLDVERENNEDVIILSKTNGHTSIRIKTLISMLQSTLYTELRGQELINRLINDVKNTGYEKIFHEWYSRYPTIFDEIAEVVYSHSSGKSTIVGDVKYDLIRVEKPYEWLLDVGLTLLTIGVVVLLAGLK